MFPRRADSKYVSFVGACVCHKDSTRLVECKGSSGESGRRWTRPELAFWKGPLQERTLALRPLA